MLRNQKRLLLPTPSAAATAMTVDLAAWSVFVFWPGHFCHAQVVLKTTAAGKHWEKIKTREDNPSLEACPENPPLLLLSSPSSSLSAFSEHDHNLMPKRPLRSSPHWRRLSSDWLTDCRTIQSVDSSTLIIFTIVRPLLLSLVSLPYNNFFSLSPP